MIYKFSFSYDFIYKWVLQVKRNYCDKTGTEKMIESKNKNKRLKKYFLYNL